MRLFHRAAPPEEESSLEVEPAAPPLPADPVELGLLLRSTRERLGVSLESVRDEIEVPLVDLDALERGELETLHTQQAAVIALWRYAERLGLDASGLVGILRSHWPNRVLAVNAIASRRGFTPNAELRTASQLLSPISDPVSLGRMSIGLSQTTKELLEARSAKHLFALQLLAPAIALQRSQLGLGSIAALRSAEPATIADPPQLSSGGVLEDVEDDETDDTRLDDRAVLERFMATTAAPEAPADGLDDVVTEDVEVAEVELLDGAIPVARPADADAVIEADEIDPEEAVAPEEQAEYVAEPIEEQIDASVELAPAEPLTIAQPVISFPAPSAIATATAAAPPAGPPPLIPSFGELIGRAQGKSRWMRYVSKFLADRLGVTPESTDPNAATDRA